MLAHMSNPNPLDRAVELASRAAIARACEVSDAAVWKWQQAQRLPQSDHVGTTTHARNIARATGGEVGEGELLDWSRSSWQRGEVSAA